MPERKSAESPPTEIEKIPLKRLWTPAPSLRPSVAMMQAAVGGHPEALAIRDAWRFHHPVRVMSAEEYEAMIERGTVTFHG